MRLSPTSAAAARGLPAPVGSGGKSAPPLPGSALTTRAENSQNGRVAAYRDEARRQRTDVMRAKIGAARQGGDLCIGVIGAIADAGGLLQGTAAAVTPRAADGAVCFLFAPGREVRARSHCRFRCRRA
jgi:hypothetical protein